jgi:hypothetical protein
MMTEDLKDISQLRAAEENAWSYYGGAGTEEARLQAVMASFLVDFAERIDALIAALEGE